MTSSGTPNTDEGPQEETRPQDIRPYAETQLFKGDDDKAASLIGPYKLLQIIGEGGMGSVWMAEQEKPVRRMVALKIIKAGMDTKDIIARFEAERQALALMDHPNIARVLDAGATPLGRPFFVMELVKGIPITEYCDRNKLPPQDRIRLFIDVCRAVQHAHQKGIIHRDIKPSNVLVTLHDGTPVVKVIDFGLAKATNQKLTEKTLFTAYGQMVGTPIYMSPEQAEYSGLDVDTRTDIYSLGVLLYALLTGTTPLQADSIRKAGYAELQRMICEQEAIPMSSRLSSLGASSAVIATERCSDPKRLVDLLRGDLDVIVLKALEKDRSRRFSTPNDFADDLNRFLNNEPIQARPASTFYRLKKLYQRNKLAVGVTAFVVFILLAATIFSTTWAIRATDAEQLAEDRLDDVEEEQQKTQAALGAAELARAEQERLRKLSDAAAEREKQLRDEAEQAAQLQAELRAKAEQSEREAKWNTYVANLYPMKQAWKDRDFGELERLLDDTTPTDGEPDYRGWEWYYFQDQVNSASQKLPFSGTAIAVNPVAPEFAIIKRSTITVLEARSNRVERTLTINEWGTLKGKSGCSNGPQRAI